VVLVRPQIAGNLGATARIMRNMGLSKLVLVAPAADPTAREARQLSTRGEETLDQAHVVASFEEAVADCSLVVGTSARFGGSFRRQSVGPPETIMPRLAEALHAGTAALVFGPEPSGLTDAEVTRCHYVVHIATDAAYPSLNLAQAVAICLYELRCTWLAQTAAPTQREPAATFAEQERMFAHLRAGLEAIHFLYGDHADSLMHAVRHVIGRAQPTAMELDVLHGLARQMLWMANRGSASESPPPPRS
jgi:tRNA/rRNA methyltransferase